MCVCICIILEPFDLTNTARSVYDYETFEHIKAVFAASWHTLEETLDLAAVFGPINLPPSSSTIAVTMSSNFENLNTATINITSTASTTYSDGEEPTEDHAIKNERNSKQYAKISKELETNAANYKEHNTFNDNNINDTDNGNYNINASATLSKVVQKFPKAKDIKPTLTPRQQQLAKKYSGKEFQKPIQIQSSHSSVSVVTPSINPPSCYNTSSKTRNSSNANPATASTATIS